jgi:hypothetical protein
MNPPRSQPSHKFSWKNLATATARGVRSIFTIVAVAWIIFALRDGTFAWFRATYLITRNRTLFVVIFLALWIWEFWFQTAKRRRLTSHLH